LEYRKEVMRDQGDDRYAWIHERIARVPRLRLALTPTPLDAATNLSRAPGGPRIFIKRDDLAEIAFGGNKRRNLEFRLARTTAEEPDRSSSGWTCSRTWRGRRSTQPHVSHAPRV
jgi:hypothetical protein